MVKKGTVATLVTGLLFATLLSTSVSAGWTELKAGRNGHFVTRAYINDTEVTALIDTGASVVAIPYEDAERLGLNPAFLNFNLKVWTANGRTIAAETTLREIDIDGVVVRNVRAVVLPEGNLRHVLIGMSFLSRLQRFEINGDTLRLVD